MTPEKKRLSQFLKAAGGRLTPSRLTILRAIYQRRGHFSGDDIFAILQQQQLPISRASVFRTIPLLVAAGLLRETLTTERHKHYECTMGSALHEHLVCLQCNSIIEIVSPALQRRFEQLSSKQGFRMISHKLEIFGLCSRCSLKE